MLATLTLLLFVRVLVWREKERRQTNTCRELARERADAQDTHKVSKVA